MKKSIEEIRSRCENKLKIMFPMGIPVDIQNRYENEMKCLEHPQCLKEFKKLYDYVMGNPNEVIYLKGTMPGSLVSFLIRGNGYIPVDLPFYYCSVCGYYEPVCKWDNCIDAPEVSCTKCGKIVRAEGYKVSMKSVFGLFGDKTVGFELEDVIHPVIEHRLKQLLKEYEVKTFENQVKLCAWATNIYLDLETENNELDMDKFKSFISSEAYMRCEIFTREDLYDKLCEKGIPNEDAFIISEFVRKGGVVRRTKEVHKYEIPEEIVSVAQNICYLESRPHAIQTAYRYWMRCTEK